jgi:hypothetical protein
MDRYWKFATDDFCWIVLTTDQTVDSDLNDSSTSLTLNIRAANREDTLNNHRCLAAGAITEHAWRQGIRLSLHRCEFAEVNSPQNDAPTAYIGKRAMVPLWETPRRR